MPRAFNCRLTPAGTSGLAGVTVMEERATEVAVRIALPEILPKLAVMVAAPPASAVARPLLFTVATEVDEVQETNGVISWLVPPEYVPRAAKFWVDRTGIAGDRVMELKVAGVEEEEEFPHVIRDTARSPRSNLSKRNLILLMGTPLGKKRPRLRLDDDLWPDCLHHSCGGIHLEEPKHHPSRAA